MAKERENLKRLKCLRRYRQRYGVEALLHRQLKERRMLATDGAAQQVRPAAQGLGPAGVTTLLGRWVSPLVPSCERSQARSGLALAGLSLVTTFLRGHKGLVLAGTLRIHTLAETSGVPRVILNGRQNCKN